MAAKKNSVQEKARVALSGAVLHPKWSGGEPKVAKAVSKCLISHGFSLTLFFTHPKLVSLRLKLGSVSRDIDFLGYMLFFPRLLLRKPKIALLFYDANSTMVNICKRLHIPTIVAVHIHWPYCPNLTFWNSVKHKSCAEVRSKDCYDCLKKYKANYLPPTRGLVDNWIKERKIALRDVSAIIVSSEFMKRMVQTELNVPETRIVVIRTGIDVSTFCPSKTSLTLSERKTVLYVGGLTYEKGLGQFLSLARLITQHRTDVQFIVIGKGPLISLAINSSDVTFLGSASLSKLIESYRKATVVVVPYLWDDPSPQVPLEAMACSTPVVSYNVGGMSECVIHGKTGFLADRGDLGSLKRYVETLLNDEALSKKMGQLSRQWVVDNFNADRMAINYVEFIESILRSIKK